jgi:serine phosphatase RsbU (regulator of sigma subunit)
MSERTLIFVSGPGLRESVPRWLEPILSQWPAADLPRITTIAHVRDLPHDAGVVLAVLHPETTSTGVREVVDTLTDKHLPGVLLCDNAQDIRSKVQRDGVLIESHDADARTIAAMLYALLERQDAVRELTRDLRISHAAQGGLCGEIDRIHEELNLASRVQRQFIPRQMPRPDGLEFASIFRPAGYVSGDIFDIRQVDEDLWAFFVADVVGHGVPAALLTMVVLRALITREKAGKEWRPVAPCDALARVNDELCQQPEGPQRFATAVYGTIDAKTREVVIAGAGHPPPLVIDSKGYFERIELEGPLLGVFESADFPQVRFTLPADRTLLLYTDGFEVAFPEEGKAGLKKATNTYLAHLGQLAQEDADGKTDLAQSLRQLEELLDGQLCSLHRIDDVTAIAIAARPRTANTNALAA